MSSYGGSRRSWRSFAVLGAGTGMRHGRALLLNSLETHKYIECTVHLVCIQERLEQYHFKVYLCKPGACQQAR